jgi:hypothetical protein
MFTTVQMSSMPGFPLSAILSALRWRKLLVICQRIGRCIRITRDFA